MKKRIAKFLVWFAIKVDEDVIVPFRDDVIVVRAGTHFNQGDLVAFVGKAEAVNENPQLLNKSEYKRKKK